VDKNAIKIYKVQRQLLLEISFCAQFLFGSAIWNKIRSFKSN